MSRVPISKNAFSARTIEENRVTYWTMDHLAADLLRPMPGGEYLLVVVDYYSRYFEIDVLKSVTSEKVVASMDCMFTTHGLPLSVKTDNGPQFVSDRFETYMRENDIEHRTSTPLWLHANGEVERQNRTLLKSMKISQAQNLDWKSELNKFLIAYRSTPHSTTPRGYPS